MRSVARSPATDDVVAEFVAAVPERDGEPALGVTLIAMDTDEQRMHVRAAVRGEARDRWIDVDGSAGGIDAFAAYLNGLLTELGHDARVYALETVELDWHVFVIRTPSQMTRLESGGWTRALRSVS